MGKLQLLGLMALVAHLSHAIPRRPFGAFTLSDLMARDENALAGLIPRDTPVNDKFVFAVTGDSWGVSCPNYLKLISGVNVD
jgi:hypothetical protein